MGNYGGAWYRQQRDFAEFPGAILVSACMRVCARRLWAAGAACAACAARVACTARCTLPALSTG